MHGTWGSSSVSRYGAAHAGRKLVRRWERPRAEPGARIRFGVPAMEHVVRNLGIDARHVLFGHLHGPGRWQTRSGVEMVNTGCWVENSVSVSPGTCVLVPSEGPPRLQSVL